MVFSRKRQQQIKYNREQFCIAKWGRPRSGVDRRRQDHAPFHQRYEPHSDVLLSRSTFVSYCRDTVKGDPEQCSWKPWSQEWGQTPTFYIAELSQVALQPCELRGVRLYTSKD
jgi:hypothetical protein